MMRTLQNTSVLFIILIFLSYDVSGSKNLTNLAGKDPACSVVPKWDICKYHYIQWQREYRWRAYYDPKDNDCYYYRGCPDNNQDLFTYDVDCREACVTGEKLKGTGKPAACFRKPKLGKCDKKVKKFWFDETDSKCKMFLSCADLNKNHWKSQAACYRSCSEGKKAKSVVANPRNKMKRITRERESAEVLAFGDD